MARLGAIANSARCQDAPEAGHGASALAHQLMSTRVTTIVTPHYRYKRPPRKRKLAAAYEEPVIVRAKAGCPARLELLRSAAT